MQATGGDEKAAVSRRPSAPRALRAAGRRRRAARLPQLLRSGVWWRGPVQAPRLPPFQGRAGSRACCCVLVEPRPEQLPRPPAPPRPPGAQLLQHRRLRALEQNLRRDQRGERPGPHRGPLLPAHRPGSPARRPRRRQTLPPARASPPPPAPPARAGEQGAAGHPPGARPDRGEGAQVGGRGGRRGGRHGRRLRLRHRWVAGPGACMRHGHMAARPCVRWGRAVAGGPAARGLLGAAA